MRIIMPACKHVCMFVCSYHIVSVHMICHLIWHSCLCDMVLIQRFLYQASNISTIVVVDDDDEDDDYDEDDDNNMI